MSLVKTLIDSLNEKKIVKSVSCNTKGLRGSINKFEKFLDEKDIEDYEKHISFIRNLQNLRSRGVGHRKGSSYKKIAKAFGLNNKDYINVFEDILKQAIDFLLFIENRLI